VLFSNAPQNQTGIKEYLAERLSLACVWTSFLSNLGTMAIAPYEKAFRRNSLFLPILFNGALENSTLRIFL
jgi:hypothetical protein